MNWNDVFAIDYRSPSGLIWNYDLIFKNGSKHYKVNQGLSAGCKDAKGRWIVMYKGKNYKCHRIIYEIFHGYINENLQIDHKDGNPSNNHIDNLELKTNAQNSRNRVKSRYNTSGMSGINFTIKKGKTYVLCKWRELDSTPRTKLFLVEKHGLLPAFKMACEYRAKMIEELNKQGAGYTERHGRNDG